MHGRERAHHERDNNRLVRPFEWGLSFISDHVNGDDPREVLRDHTAQAMAHSEDFYALPEISDFQLTGDQLTWTSAIHTPSVENNLARARYFPVKPKKARQPRAAVVVLPQWNAQPDSHVEACRIFNFIGMSASAFDASLSRRATAAGVATRRSSGQHQHRPHDSVDATGRARYARRGEVAKESGLRTHWNPGHQRRIVHRVSGVCA